MTGGTNRQSSSDSSYNTNANKAVQNLEAASVAGTIEEVDGATALSLANQGYTVVGAQENPSGKGHLNVVTSYPEYDSSLGPMTSDVGGRPGGMRYAEDAFLTKQEVTYYYDPEQDRTVIDDSQVLNTWGY